MSTHPCQNCDRAFGSYQARNAHKTVHDTDVEIECSVCGTTFTVKPYREETAITCSKECHDVWQSKNRSGEGHHSWRHDVESEELAEDFTSGMSLHEVARKYDMSVPGITPRIKDYGVDVEEVLDGRKSSWHTIRCEECDEEFEVDDYWLEKRRFCSRACSARAGVGFLSTKETSFGLTVKSTYEVKVAEYLYSQGYDFEYEPQLEAAIPDFMIGDGVIIEVWGMMDSESYRERRLEKEEWYRESGYELISIEPDDLEELDQRLGHRLVQKEI